MLKEKKEKSITIRITDDLFDAYCKLATITGMSLSEYIRLVLESHCRKA